MSNQPNEAAEKLTEIQNHCREWEPQVRLIGNLSAEDIDAAIGWANAEISSLRSALAAAEKDRAASARDWEAALSAHDRRVEELNQALAKLAGAERDCAGYKDRIHELSDGLGACEKELHEATECLRLTRGELDAIKNTPQANEGTNICGHNRYWLSNYGRCMACERDAALAKLAEAEEERDEFAEKVGELAFIRHNLTEERNSLAAQLAEAREALAKIAGLDYRNAATNGAAYSAHQIASAFLTPPPDRGAEATP